MFMLLFYDVLPSTWHVPGDRKLFDVGKILFLNIKREEIKPLGLT